MVRPIDTSTLGPITTMPNAADELAKAVDAIQAAEGAVARAQAAVSGNAPFQSTMEVAGQKLRAIRTYLMLVRGGPKAEPPPPFVGGHVRG